MPARCRKGLTLLEVLISMVLFGIILSATYAALTLAMRYSMRMRDQSDLQKETLVAVNRIERSLAGAAVDSVEIDVDQDAICFVSAQSSAGFYTHDPATGEPLFQRYVCFYAEGRRLLVKERVLTPPSLTYTNVVPDSLITDASLPAVELTENLERLVFTEGSAVGLDLTLQSQLDPANGMSVLTRVYLRL